jgi:hypothetical protein
MRPQSGGTSNHSLATIGPESTCFNMRWAVAPKRAAPSHTAKLSG